MIRVNIKPLSVNKAWKGKRYKTNDYNNYENALLKLLPRISGIKKPLKLEIVFGFSNAGSDIDNPLKPFIDILQKRYLINDKDIFELNVKKVKVEKGFDFIDFKISQYEK